MYFSAPIGRERGGAAVSHLVVVGLEPGDPTRTNIGRDPALRGQRGSGGGCGERRLVAPTLHTLPVHWRGDTLRAKTSPRRRGAGAYSACFFARCLSGAQSLRRHSRAPGCGRIKGLGASPGLHNIFQVGPWPKRSVRQIPWTGWTCRGSKRRSAWGAEVGPGLRRRTDAGACGQPLAKAPTGSVALDIRPALKRSLKCRSAGRDSTSNIDRRGGATVNHGGGRRVLTQRKDPSSGSMPHIEITRESAPR